MKLDYTKSPNGLIPAIIQDIRTNNVLMLGYMNEEALIKTLSEKRVTFFSRSKNRLWTKGETSGNFLNVVSIKGDCDNDTLLIKVLPQGPVCHTGSETCFGEAESNSFLPELERLIEYRKNNSIENSYVSKLLNSGINKVAQKVGEEATEVIIEAKDNNDDSFLNEAADLLFHYLILLQAKGFKLYDVESILKQRNRKN